MALADKPPVGVICRQLAIEIRLHESLVVPARELQGGGEE